MRRRFLPHVCMLATLLAWSSDAAAKPPTSWAPAELRAVVAAGLMAKEAAARDDERAGRKARHDARTCGHREALHGGREDGRAVSAVALRHGGCRTPARSAHQPSGVARQAGAVAERTGKPRRSRVLRGAHPSLRRVGRLLRSEEHTSEPQSH